MSAHASNLQLQGVTEDDVDHIALAKLDSSSLSPKDRALLEFVRILTLAPAKTRDEGVEGLRTVGWTDPEIFETAFITSLFAFLNRMADAYGLDYNMNRWIPPEMRASSSQPVKSAPRSVTVPK